MNRKSIKEQIREKLRASESRVFIASDFTDIGTRASVGRALRALSTDGTLIRIGLGIYAKARMSVLTRQPSIVASFPDVAREALEKLNIRVYPDDGGIFAGSTQVPTGLCVMVGRRTTRKLTYNGRSIRYEYITA